MPCDIITGAIFQYVFAYEKITVPALPKYVVMNSLVHRILPALSLFAFATSATAQSYDPFAHEQNASIIMAGWSAGVAIGVVPLLFREDSLARTIGRQALMWGVIDAASAGAQLYLNELDRQNGVSIPDKTFYLQQGIRIDALVDFTLLAIGVVLIQHAKKQKNVVRGWRWVIRGGVHLAYDAASYSLTYRR